MPRGAGPKREQEYEELKERFKEEGRYEGREEEVAARIVNKQRAEYGETKEARQQDREGRSPDRHLPIRNFDNLTLDELVRQLDRLSRNDLRELLTYEEKHKNREGLRKELEKRLDGG